MSVELVTGYSGVGEDGEPNRHVSSAEDGARQAGTLGLGCYALSTGSKLSATMEDANTLVVADGDVVMNGRHVSLPDPTSFTIPTGVQGQKVSNIAVLRYEKAADSTESVTPLVLTGEPSADAPADPAYNNGSILDGDSPVDMPLYRVVTDGINAGDPEPLFDVLAPMAELRDLVSQGIVGAATLMLTSDITAPVDGDYAQGSFRKISGFGPITINEQGQVVFGRAGSALLVGQACVTDVSAGDLCHLRVGLTMDWHSQFRASGDYDAFSVAPGMIPVSAGQTFRPWYRCEQGGGSRLYAEISRFTFLLFGK